jgi:hypothetical protein
LVSKCYLGYVEYELFQIWHAFGSSEDEPALAPGGTYFLGFASSSLAGSGSCGGGSGIAVGAKDKKNIIIFL